MPDMDGSETGEIIRQREKILAHSCHFSHRAQPGGAAPSRAYSLGAVDYIVRPIVVRDRGVGIPPESQGRVFERFERLSQNKWNSGFGLGLWIVKRVTTELGGQVELSSEVGAGSSFTVVLPKDGSQEVAAPAKHADSPPPAPDPN